MILAPLVRGRKGTHKDIFDRIRKAGFVRVRVDGLVCELEDVPPLVAQKKHHIDAVVDRVIIRENIESRLTESVQVALENGDGLMSICYLDESQPAENGGPPAWQDELFSTKYACPDCRLSYEELEPRTFSFNSPYGACPLCQGLGTIEEFDPELVIPNRDLSLSGGAIAPWKSSTPAARKKHLEVVERFAEQLKLSPERPLRISPTSIFSCC